MNAKNLVIILVTIIVSLFVAYVVISDLIERKPKKCGSDACVSFCSNFENETNINIHGRDETQHLKETYKILGGNPCEESYIEDLSPWTFYEVKILKTKIIVKIRKKI